VQPSLELTGDRNVKLQKGLQIREKITLIVKVAIIRVAVVIVVKYVEPPEVAIYVNNLFTTRTWCYMETDLCGVIKHNSVN
jgi:hypothetical protein